LSSSALTMYSSPRRLATAGPTRTTYGCLLR
jgi:hypothetical protein